MRQKAWRYVRHLQKEMDASNTLLPIVSTAVADAAHFGIIGRKRKGAVEAAACRFGSKRAKA
jgi:hypothetical protein